MLGNKNTSMKVSGSTTLISRDTTLTGSIEFAGSIDIEGTVVGNIEARAGKDAVVRVLGKGRVEGEIKAPTIVINGEVEGDVHASKQLQLASKARVKGNVYYAQVEMSVGSEVNGRLQPITEAGNEAVNEPDIGKDSQPYHKKDKAQPAAVAATG
jgi:cytoskeletal protein CcmA (bactofilin family)